MRFWGILRVSGLFILASAFHGQPVSCGFFNWFGSSKKDSNAKVSEIPEDSTVKSQAVENPKDSTVEVSEISEKPKDSTVKSQVAENPSQEPSKSSAPAPKSGLVFENATWHDSMLANTVLFINEFCEGVKAEKFKEHIPDDIYEDLSGSCSWVSFYMKPFRRHVPTSSALWNLYKDALKSDKFKDYAEWLEKHLPEIKKSMINMHNDTGKYSGRQLQTNMKKLVSKYGFVCNGDWYTGIVPPFDARGKGALTFLEAFDYLRKTLDKVLKNAPTKSTEA